MSYGIARGDIEARWRPLDAEEVLPAQTLVVDAETLLDIQPELRALAENFGKSPHLDRLVVMTVCNMVIRVLRNPDAMRQQSVGDVQQTFGGPDYDGRLYVADEELAMISGALAALSPVVSAVGAFSFDPTRSKLAARRAPWRRSTTRPR